MWKPHTFGVRSVVRREPVFQEDVLQEGGKFKIILKGWSERQEGNRRANET